MRNTTLVRRRPSARAAWSTVRRGLAMCCRRESRHRLPAGRTSAIPLSLSGPGSCRCVADRRCVCVCVCVCVRARVCVWLRPRSRCFGVSVLCGCTCCVISCRSLNVSVPQCSWRTYRSFQPCLLCGLRFNRPTSRGERTFASIYTALHVTKHMSPFQPPSLKLPPHRRKASSASCA